MDSEDELAKIRQERIDRLKKAEEAKKAEEKLKVVLRQVLLPSAYDRLMNVSVANKELYLTAAQQIVGLSERAGRRITEEELLKVLRLLKSSTEKKTKIIFHEK